MKGKLVKAAVDLRYCKVTGPFVIPAGSMGIVTSPHPDLYNYVRVTWFITDYDSTTVPLIQLEIVETAKPLRGRPFKEKVDVEIQEG